MTERYKQPKGEQPKQPKWGEGNPYFDIQQATEGKRKSPASRDSIPSDQWSGPSDGSGILRENGQFVLDEEDRKSL